MPVRRRPVTTPINGDDLEALVSWRAYVDVQLDALRAVNDAAERALEVRLVAEQKTLDARFSAADKALLLATAVADERWRGANEFRGSLSDTLVVVSRLVDKAATKEDISQLRERFANFTGLGLHDALEKRIVTIENWQARQEGKASQSSVNIAYLLSGGALLLGLIDFLIRRIGIS